MKRFFFSLALIVGMLGAFASKPIHAIYSLEREWKSPADVCRAELAPFDFIYIMAGPDWKPEQMELPLQDVIKINVTDHQYEYADGMKALIDSVHANGSKILCSFPGPGFLPVATDPAKMEKFAQMAAAFIKKYDFDGIEVDWEHDVREDLHLGLMQQLRQALNTLETPDRKYYLTTALNDYPTYTPELAAELSQAVDWVNIMFYDMGGGIWGKVPTHNSPLDRMDASFAKNWWMFSPEKLHVGMPNYGFYYRNIKPGETVAEGKNLKDYGRYCMGTELPALLEAGWTEVWDDQAQCPYYFSPDGTEFMTLESPRSLTAKYNWTRDKGFGGIFWWEFNCDRVANPDPTHRHLLTDTVIELIKNEE